MSVRDVDSRDNTGLAMSLFKCDSCYCTNTYSMLLTITLSVSLLPLSNFFSFPLSILSHFILSFSLFIWWSSAISTFHHTNYSSLTVSIPNKKNSQLFKNPDFIVYCGFMPNCWNIPTEHFYLIVFFLTSEEFFFLCLFWRQVWYRMLLVVVFLMAELGYNKSICKKLLWYIIHCATTLYNVWQFLALWYCDIGINW